MPILLHLVRNSYTCFPHAFNQSFLGGSTFVRKKCQLGLTHRYICSTIKDLLMLKIDLFRMDPGRAFVNNKFALRLVSVL